MVYFSYGTDLSVHAVLDFCRSTKRPVPRRLNVRPAVLTNHRIHFARHDSFFGGGVADIAVETGKSVSGAMMNISELGLETLRKLSGVSSATTVKVTPLEGGPPIEAVTLFDGQNNQSYVPPTAAYLDRLANAAAELGLSMMWVMHLKTFPSINSPQQRSSLKLEFTRDERVATLPRHRVISPVPVQPAFALRRAIGPRNNPRPLIGVS